MGKTNSSEAKSRLDVSFEKAMEFSVDSTNKLVFSKDILVDIARRESSEFPIEIDINNCTPFMREELVKPAKEALRRWRSVKADFDAAIQPYLEEITAVDDLAETIEGIREKENDNLSRFRKDKQEDIKYTRANNELVEADQQFQEIYMANGQQMPNMYAYKVRYLFLILIVGVAEWLINYDTFLEFFFKIPAIAAGTTIILGGLLAFASHGHGTLLRQYNARFGHHHWKNDRAAEVRFFVLSTLSVLVVLAAAGSARYVWATSKIVLPLNIGIIPNAILVAVNPIRDVVFSMLANLGAWLLGVLIAYFAHDKNPELMSRLRQRQRAERQFHKLDASYKDRMATIAAQADKDVLAAERTAVVKHGIVREQRDKFLAIERHEDQLLKNLGEITQDNLDKYQVIISDMLKSNGKVLKKMGNSLSGDDYKKLKIKVNRELFLEPNG